MKSVSYLVEYAKAQVGRPYWMGTYGQIADAALLAYKRTQYPAGYPDPGKPAFKAQLGQKVHDCNGLVFAASECNTPDSKPNKYPSPYYAVPTLYKHCDDTGNVTEFSKLVKGELLFRGNFGHVGIYGGDGYVYHAKGHAWGVIKEKYDHRQWTHHGKFREMYLYENPHEGMTINIPVTLNFGKRGPNVKAWQGLLLAEGYELPRYGQDGEFGSETAEATRAFQVTNGLVDDGIVGYNTWEKMLNRLHD